MLQIRYEETLRTDGATDGQWNYYMPHFGGIK